MRPPGNNTRPIIFGFILATGITLTLSHFAFGAVRSVADMGIFRAPQMQQQHAFSRPFPGIGWFGFGGVSEPPNIIIQQFQPATAAQPNKPAENRIYVEPRWVDGGHGVEVLQPGYWADPKQTEKR